MNHIYKMAKRIHERTGWKETSLFLCFNVMLWACLAFFVGIFLSCLVLGGWGISGVVLFCTMGYAAVFFGFFGGVIYLYQK